jgi:4-amino-4-deoxy-L-arabinose transferase-like glycosyltransferase
MEAAGALGRGSLSTYLEAVGEAVRSRSRVFWIVAGLTVLAAAIRFATLGVQSYHHDEIVTASRILRDGFWHAMDAVGFSESAPPLYYAVAWLWTQVTGTGEFGLRSVSALAGVATVPVAFLLGAELRGRRTGIVAAALVAVNPMLVWYSQEARAYALFALLTALWLLHRRGKATFPGLGILGAAGLALAPLAIHQMSIGHAEWIGGFSLGHRLWETGLTFMLGETGDVIARPEHPLLAAAPCLLGVIGLVLVVARGDRRERRAAGIPLGLAAVTVVVPVALGLLDPGKDYVLARNLMPALVPLLVAFAVGFTMQRARRGGAILAALLVVYSLGFSVWASISPALQRPDWDAVASAVGEPTTPRAMVTWTLGEASLRYYLSTGSFQVQPSDGFNWWVGEVDFISDGPVPPPPKRLLGPGFRQAGYQQVDSRLYLRRYVHVGPGLEPLRLGTIRDAKLGFRSNGVLLDGIGPK